MTMAGSVRQRIPVVAGLAYAERVRLLPSSFSATLVAEPDNRYFRHAIAVTVSGQKVGYVAPEVASRYFDAVKGSASPIECPARRAAQADHETSGVELLLDFSNLPIPPGE
jgi:hypothetical protein